MPTYTLTMNTIKLHGSNGTVLNGTIPLQPDYEDGTPVTLTAVSDAKYRLESWSGDLTSGANPVVITMDVNKVITATFDIHAIDKIQGEKLYATEYNSAARDINYLNNRVRKSVTAPPIGSLEGGDLLVAGDLWLDTSGTLSILKRWNGTTWDQAGAATLSELPGDIDDIPDNTFSIPGVTDWSISAEKSESASGFHCWIKIAITRVDNAGGYVIGYKESTLMDYITLSVDQPPSGNPAVATPYLTAGTLYDVRICTISKLGLTSGWSAVKQITTLTDSVAPSAPTSLTATGIVNGVLLEWTECTSDDFAFYNIYAQNANPPTIKVGTSTRPIYAWPKGSSDDYETFWFLVNAVDTAGNTSSVSNTISAIPLNPEVDDIDDPALPIAAFSVIANEIDTSASFRTWFQITITLVTGSGGYTVSYKKATDTYWIDMFIPEPTSGSTVICTTPDLEANTSYHIRVCTLTKLGQSSAWSGTTTISTSTNNTAPGIPTAPTPIATVDGVLLSWTAVTATDLAFYRVYYGTTSSPITLAGETSRLSFFWKKLDSETFVPYYFKISSVDSAGNESTKGTVSISATPLQVKPIDLTVESRPWTANFKMWEDETTYGKLYWAAADGVSNATVKFADGTTKSITKNTSGTSYSVGITYFYWDTTSTLAVTTDYGTAVGEGKGLVCVVDVRTDRRSTILPFGSYIPTIGSGAIAAKTILTDHIKAAQITTTLVTSDSALAIKASQIVLDGTTTFVNSWSKAGDLTTIDGGKISTGTVDTVQLKAKAVTTDKLTVGISNLVPDGDFEAGDRTKEWDTGTASSSSPHGGSYCLSVPAGSESLLNSFIPVLPSTNYLLKGWVRAVSGGTSALKLKWYTENKVLIDSQSTTSVATSWTLLSISKALPATAYYVKVSCSATAQICYFDDLFLRRQIFTNDLDQYAVVADSIATDAVEANKIKAGAVTTSKLNVTSIFLDGITWTNNTPTNSISWSSGTVYFNGDAHSITGGTCDVGDKYIYWDHASPTIFQHTISTAQPSYGDEIFMVAINISGSRRLVWNATMIHGGTLITGSITAQEIEADTITADKLKTGTITGAQQNRLLPNDDLFKIVSTGASYSSPSVRGIYDGREGTTIAQATRSYMVSIYDRSTKAWVSHTSYDVFASTANATAMANALNALDNTKIVIIHAYDEPQTNHTFGTLPAAMERCGASKGIFEAGTGFFFYRSAYILVGIPGVGEGNGIELYSGASDSDVNAYCETTIAIQNGNILDLRKSLLNITADKVVISGTTYLTSWTHGTTKIDGGKIDTGTVTTDAIAAKAITTDKLSVGLGNLLADGDFELGDATKEWVGGTATSSSPHGGTYCLSIASGAAANSKTATAIQPNNKFYGSIWAKKLTGGTAYFYIYWYDINGTYISGSSVGSSSSLTWAEIAGQVTAPANAYYMRAYINATGNTCYFDDCFIRKQIISGDMTQYSILADSIGAGEVKAGKIDALAVSTGNLAAGAVTADKLTINQIILKDITFSSHWDVGAGTYLLNWTSGYIIYNGTSYAISSNTNQGAYYLYWDPPNTTLTFSNTKPAYTSTRCFILVFSLTAGTINYVWNATIIDGKSITTGTITADEIAASTITGNKIAAQTLTTSLIAFNLLSSDPAYYAGELWYRSDLDQLRFSKGTTLADVAVIPKYPLGSGSTPTENMVLNPCFEIDRGDGVPLYWEYVGTNPPTLSSADSSKGSNSIYFNVPAGGAANASLYTLYPYYIPVTALRYYHLTATVKYVQGTAMTIRVHWIAKNKSTEISYSDLAAGSVATWTTLTGTRIQAPATSYYARIEVFIYHPALLSQSYLGEVVLSEARAASPTGGIVGGSGSATTSTDTFNHNAWTASGATFTIPSTAHEEYFVDLGILNMASVVDNWGLGIRIKLTKAGETTEYYPSSTYEYCPFREIIAGARQCVSALLVIPKDRQGWLVTPELYIDHAGAGTLSIKVASIGWGHSPHYHA